MYLDLEQGSIILTPNKTNGVFATATLIISSVGVALSMLALLLLLITACLFREWRRNYKNQLLIQFMLARCAYTFVRYFFDIRTIFNILNEDTCIFYLDEVTMIYTEIVLVAWMYIFSRQMYDSLVKVFDTETPNICKVSLTTWIVPVIVTLVLYVLYDRQSGNALMIFFLYLAIVKWPLLIANAVILIMILKSLTKPNIAKMNTTNSNLRLVIVMNFLIFFFGFQQAFLDIYKLIYVVFNLPSYLLIIMNIGTMYHCAMAIRFWVFGNAKTRMLWRNKLCCVRKIPLSQQSSLSSTK